MLVVYLVVFFLVAYLVFGALMLAVGAAVNQMADAQSLMGPIMLLLIVPYVLTPIIGQAPNSTLSVALSFMPPINTFAMLARLASRFAAARLAGGADRARGPGVRRHGPVVCGEGVQDRPADARQAAELRNAHPLGAQLGFDACTAQCRGPAARTAGPRERN